MFYRRIGRVLCLLLAVIALQATASAEANPGIDTWDPLLPRVASAGAPGDPLAVANASLRAGTLAAQTTMDLGRAFLQSLGLASSDVAAPTGLNRVSGAQAIEYVIRRAGSQIGVPYSWGGGNLTGPSAGIDSGANTIGFDCSGLTRYAYAGVAYCSRGGRVTSTTLAAKFLRRRQKRGDLLFFWGPGGSQHEAIYLGGGQMLEAQQTGVPVKVSPSKDGGGDDALCCSGH